MPDKAIYQPGDYQQRFKDEGGGVYTPYVNVNGLPGLDLPPHDYIGLSYTGENLTGVVYKTGGSDGQTVATLVLAYTDDKLTSVTKS